jgi:RNA polymerase sigma factor (TIGR02999 family)
MVRVQHELHRLARGYLRRERGGHTLQPTAVVNEAYMRLVAQREVPWASRAHFFGIAARMMRRVLVDHARRRQAVKRDVGDAAPLSLTGIAAPTPGIDAVDLLILHDALTTLARLDARQAEIVEMKYFGGLTVEEIAEVLGISVSSVKREWTTAKVWLRHSMQGH